MRRVHAGPAGTLSIMMLVNFDLLNGSIRRGGRCLYKRNTYASIFFPESIWISIVATKLRSRAPQNAVIRWLIST